MRAPALHTLDAKRYVPSDVRSASEGFTEKYLHHEDRLVRFYAIRALRFARPPLTVAELKSHDRGSTFACLEVLQSDAWERLSRLAAQLVEYVLAEELRPGVGSGYKALLKVVKRGPGTYADAGASPEPEVAAAWAPPPTELAQQIARREEAADRERKREEKLAAAAESVDRFRQGPLTGHQYGLCRVCNAKVRLCDDFTVRKHYSFGRARARDDGEESCGGSNQLALRAFLV